MAAPPPPSPPTSPTAPPAPRRRLVLASASPARLRLLTQAGMAPEVSVSGVDEDGIDDTDPAALVQVLASAKASAVAERPEAAGAIVVGCDSMLWFGGAVMGKPTSADDAIARLSTMRGRTGDLLTGHCAIDTLTGARAEGVASTTVRFGSFTDAELAAYVATGEALEVAGAFTLDGRSAPFIDGIDGDPSNVIGLSLPLLRTLLGDLGVTVMDLWA